MYENDETNLEVEKLQNKIQTLKKDIKWFSLFVFFLLLIRSIFIEPYRIPTGSMMPTLISGDFILVNKFAYGLKIPFSDLVFKLPFTQKQINLDPIYLYRSSSPKRGEVVVFKYPVDPEVNYIKRIIAIPGDQLEIRQKKIYLNGKMIDVKAIDDLEMRKNFEKVFKDYNYDLYQSKIAEHSFKYQLNRGNFYNINYKKIVIPPNKYFVMGDNRDFSYDSRSWGFVDENQIKGRAILIWFSLTFPSFETKFSFNPDRIGQKI